MKQYYIYILESKKIGTLYIGMTNDLVRRIYEHKNKLIAGFSSKYNVNNLVYFDITDNVNSAIHLEKKLKGWQRKWKIDLIKKSNPNWEGLYNKIIEVN